MSPTKRKPTKRAVPNARPFGDDRPPVDADAFAPADAGAFADAGGFANADAGAFADGVANAGDRDASDAKSPGADRRRPSSKRKTEASKRKKSLAGRIAGGVIGALAVVIIVCFAFFSWGRWFASDDRADLEGTWYVVGTTTPITITSDAIVLSEDASYAYTVDPFAKSLSYTFGNLSGSGRYRFSQDRQTLAIIEGGAVSWFDTLCEDLARSVENAWRQLVGQDPLPLAGEQGAVVITKKAPSAPGASGDGADSSANNASGSGKPGDAKGADGSGDAGAAESAPGAGAGAAGGAPAGGSGAAGGDATTLQSAGGSGATTSQGAGGAADAG